MLKKQKHKFEDEIREALSQERRQRAERTEEAAEGLVREHKTVPRVGRPPKKTETS